MNLTRSIMIIPVAALLLTGCANPSAYKDPIAAFQTASTVVIESARIEYQAVNKRELYAEIDRRVAKGEKITLPALEETRLLNGDDLIARMNSLDALAEHGNLLFILANSGTPDKAKNAANSLDDAVVRLSTALGRASSDEFKNKAGAIATIAGEVTKLVLNAKIKQALKKSIILSENDVPDLIKLLKNDMDMFRERRRNIQLDARLLATNEYNRGIASNSSNPEKLKKAAAEIKKVEDAWDDLFLLPDPGFEEMGIAHRKLVEYAKTSQTPQTLAELVEAMDTFTAQAKIIADAIKTIQQKKEN